MQYGYDYLPASNSDVLPDAVTGLTASQGTSLSQIDLSWNASAHAASYDLYRSATAGGAGTLLGNVPDNGTGGAQTYANTGLASGTTYYYTVVAKNAAGSAPASTEAMGYTGMLPGTPTNVTASQGTRNQAIQVNWTAPAGTFTAYHLYKDGNATPIADVAFGTTVYLDQAIAAGDTAEHTYQVAAYNSLGTGTLSDSATGYANQPPTATTATLTAGIGGDSVTVTPAVTDPNEAAGQTESYTFTLLTQPPTGQGSATIYGNALQYTPPATGAAFSTSFTYQVTDKGGASLDGTATVTVSLLPPASAPPISATQGTLTGQVQVSWDSGSAVPGADGYHIYRDGTAVGTVGPNAISFDDDLGTDASVHNYVVKAYNTAGEGPASNTAPGYANQPPTATSATLSAFLDGDPVSTTPSVTDPNASAGQTESYTFTLLTQPPAGQGTSGLSNNVLTYTPPAGATAFSTSFTYRVTDKGGASLDGTATVNVSLQPPAGAPAVTATQGTLTGIIEVTLSGTGAISRADGYHLYRDGTLVTTLSESQLTFQDNVGASASDHTYIAKAYNAAGEGPASSPATGYANQPPTGASASIAVATGIDSAPTVPVVIDPNNPRDSFIFTSPSHPDHGAAAVVGGALVYTSEASYVGTDTFTFLVTDRAGETTVGTAVVTVSQDGGGGGGGGGGTGQGCEGTECACLAPPCPVDPTGGPLRIYVNMK